MVPKYKTGESDLSALRGDFDEGSVHRLVAKGYGVFEPKAGKNLPTLMSLALSKKAEEREEFQRLIKEDAWEVIELADRMREQKERGVILAINVEPLPHGLRCRGDYIRSLSWAWNHIVHGWDTKIPIRWEEKPDGVQAGRDADRKGDGHVEAEGHSVPAADLARPEGGDRRGVRPESGDGEKPQDG